jgi:hypothetical protein
MALFPMAFVVYEAMMYAHRSKNRAKKSIPAIIDTEKNARLMKDEILGVVDDEILGAFVAELKRSSDGTNESTNRHDATNEIGIGGNNDDSSGSGSSSEDVEGNLDNRLNQYLPHLLSEHDNSDDHHETKKDVDKDDDDDDANASHDSNAECDLTVTDKKLYLLRKRLHKADFALKNYLVDNGLNTATDFDFCWPEHSDEYRYLYQRPMAPFVNKQGEEVSIHHIQAKRDHAVKTDFASFKNKQRLAKIGVQKRTEFMKEWDKFRLYDSDLIFSFINHADEKVSTDEIKAARDLMKGVSKPAVAKSDMLKQLYALKKKMQLMEHNLLAYIEELTYRD